MKQNFFFDQYKTRLLLNLSVSFFCTKLGGTESCAHLCLAAPCECFFFFFPGFFF